MRAYLRHNHERLTSTPGAGAGTPRAGAGTGTDTVGTATPSSAAKTAASTTAAGRNRYGIGLICYVAGKASDIANDSRSETGYTVGDAGSKRGARQGWQGTLSRARREAGCWQGC